MRLSYTIRFNIDIGVKNYIMSTYNDCYTNISCGDIKIENIHLSRGVKQGDPLSPILFNMMMGELIDTLPPEVGVSLINERFNCLAFADNLILVAETPVGMQLLRHLEEFLKDRSLQVNTKKCFSLQLTTSLKDRAPIVNKEPNLYNASIKATSYGDSFKYLGIRYDPNGKMRPNVLYLSDILAQIKKSPLKPFQKLSMLRANVIPKLSHGLVLGRITKGLLNIL